MKLTTTVSASLFALSVASAAIAGAPDAPGTRDAAMMQSPSFEQVDANKDGAATREEVGRANALPDIGFDKADQDKDGKISRDEYDAAARMNDPQKGG